MTAAEVFAQREAVGQAFVWLFLTFAAALFCLGALEWWSSPDERRRRYLRREARRRERIRRWVDRGRR